MSKPANQSNTYRMSRGGTMIGNEGDNAFNSVELTRPNGSVFDLSHSVSGTAKFGQIIPCNTPIECYPGDRFTINHELLIRSIALVTPAMQRMDATVHTFFIPERILHRDDIWAEFIRGEAITRPYLDLNAADTVLGSLADYIGVPKMTGDNTVRVLASPFCAIQRVFYEYYRNQNLSSMTDNDKPYLLTGDNAAQKTMLLTMRKRAWMHDYFTSALPFTQKGTESQINVEFQDVPVRIAGTPVDPTGLFEEWDSTLQSAGTPSTVGATRAVPDPLATVSNGFLFAQTSALSGTSFTINEFRIALATQHWLERMAVGGTRYTEIIRAHFGVSSSDQRLDRPEYIGGLKTPIVISEVQQTSESATTPQGNLAGHGIAASFTSQGDRYECEEHGWIMSFLTIIPRAKYTTALHRSLDWNARNTRDELYWPQFANLGEQAIKFREIFADTEAQDQNADWAYTGRYNELRGLPSRVCGELKGGSLDMWTAARKFTEPPTLSEDFITEMANDTDRLFPVASSVTPPLIFDVYHEIEAYRLMPKYATPELQG